MKRCYYISNSYDGAYFVLTDNIEEYFQRMSSYLLNLEDSHKCNSYSFGSVELTEKQYLEQRTGASFLERSLVAEKEKKKEVELKPHHIIAETGTEVDDEDDFDLSATPPTPKKGERPHLRLV